jgi:hypothetical protein
VPGKLYSGGVRDKHIFDVIFHELNNPSYANRIMFGTDFFLTEREQPEKNTYLNFKDEAKKITLSNFNYVNAWDRQQEIILNF